jgi:hypothetical protein
MDHLPKANGCPFGKPNEQSVVYSSNHEFWEDCRVNTRAMAANLRPAVVGETDSYVPWFAPDSELLQAVTLRKYAYHTDPDRILRTGDANQHALRAAASQLLELQANYLVSHYPESYSIKDSSKLGRYIINKITSDVFVLDAGQSPLHPLAISGLLGQEDLCLVEQTDDGRHVLVAGFVATPTDWELAKLIGKDMDQIHFGFASYQERLKKVVDDTLTELPGFPVMKYRNNLFSDYVPTLAIFSDGVIKVDANSVTDPGQEISLRSERETLIRLPSTNTDSDDKKRFVFTIKPHVLTLSEATQILSNDKLKKLVEAFQKNTVLNRNEQLAEIALGYLEDYVE